MLYCGHGQCLSPAVMSDGRLSLSYMGYLSLRDPYSLFLPAQAQLFKSCLFLPFLPNPYKMRVDKRRSCLGADMP